MHLLDSITARVAYSIIVIIVISAGYQRVGIARANGRIAIIWHHGFASLIVLAYYQMTR